jgi:hypothetical protein
MKETVGDDVVKDVVGESISPKCEDLPPLTRVVGGRWV